jgi:hypothetical protein
MGKHVRVSCRLYEAEDTDLYAALTALEVEDRNRRARALMRLGFMAERGSSTLQLMPQPAGLSTGTAPAPMASPAQDAPTGTPAPPSPADALMELGLDLSQFALA